MDDNKDNMAPVFTLDPPSGLDVDETVPLSLYTRYAMAFSDRVACSLRQIQRPLEVSRLRSHHRLWELHRTTAVPWIVRLFSRGS